MIFFFREREIILTQFLFHELVAIIIIIILDCFCLFVLKEHWYYCSCVLSLSSVTPVLYTPVKHKLQSDGETKVWNWLKSGNWKYVEKVLFLMCHSLMF